ncbi:MAG: hypothetical protein FWG21_00315 [Oscillospiraceae bacterium]|nr:hypothetical protein [Oscillospiraceae bacterium]
MSCLSENAGILAHNAYGADTKTDFWDSLQTLRIYRIADSFSFNFGVSVPESSECEEVVYPHEITDSRLFYLNLKENNQDEYFDTVLLIEGAVVNASVFINGHSAATISNTLTGCMIRITGYLKTSNHIFIRFEPNMSGRTEQIHSIKSIRLPKSRITDIYPRSYINQQKARILCDIGLVSGDMKTALGGSLRVTILDENRNEVATVEKKVDSFERNFWKTIRVTVDVEQPHLWNLDDPYRYTLKVEFYSIDQSLCDTKEIPCGIRQLSIMRYSGKVPNTPTLLINNNPVRITGLVIHQQDEMIPKQLKALGLNAVRVINPYNNAFFDACDREGILVMCEANLNVPYIRPNLFSNRKRKADPLDVPFALLGEMIVRFKHHPSIFCWSTGVRKPYGNTVIGEFIRSLDDSRAVNCQGDNNFLLSDFFSADDCDLERLNSIETNSYIFENGFFGVHFRPTLYRQHPFLLCDVDIKQPDIIRKLDIFRYNRRFLGLFLSASDETDILSYIEQSDLRLGTFHE